MKQPTLLSLWNLEVGPAGSVAAWTAAEPAVILTLGSGRRTSLVTDIEEQRELVHREKKMTPACRKSQDTTDSPPGRVCEPRPSLPSDFPVPCKA